MHEAVMKISSLDPNQLEMRELGELLVKLDEAICKQYIFEHDEEGLRVLQKDGKPLVSITNIEANCTSAVMNITDEMYPSYSIIPNFIKNPQAYITDLSKGVRDFIEYTNKFAVAKKTNVEFIDSVNKESVILHHDNVVVLESIVECPTWTGDLVLFGEIYEIGGKRKPRFHLSLPNHQLVKLDVESKEQVEKMAGFIYKQVKITGQATYMLASKTETIIKKIDLKNIEAVKTDLTEALDAIRPYVKKKLDKCDDPTYGIRRH